jgi:hypothetical protein
MRAPSFSNQYEVGIDEQFPQFDATDLGYIAGEKIEFPELAHYGFDHGDKTAKLALVILGECGGIEMGPSQQKALWTAALFHDIGRRAELGKPDPEHAQRGATIVEAILRGMPDLWHDEVLRNTACRLVANHSKRPETKDPLAMALWDADHFEAARFEPGTQNGLLYLKTMSRPETLCTDWARSRSRLKTYMEFRGW